MNAYRLLMIVAGLLALGVAEAGTLYKIVDKDGNVTYTSRPPANASGRVERKEITNAPGEPDAEEALARLAQEKPVVLYTVEECEQCNRAREYLQKRGTPFTEKDVNKDTGFRAELKSRTGSLYIPTITLGDKVMKGYIQSLLEGELDAAGYPRAAPVAASPPGETGAAEGAAEGTVDEQTSPETNVTEGGADIPPEEPAAEVPAQ
jgi:glutaredoxin